MVRVYKKNHIDSDFEQTLTDFEFLIIDDGSTDRTVEIIQGYTDKRIRFRAEMSINLFKT